jgi:glycosyltransferase involved in cell wall biosynthesis
MTRGSIMILSPWPSIFSAGGGGGPRGQDLIDALLEAGYAVDFVAMRAHDGDSFPNRAGLRVHSYGPLRFGFGGFVGRVLTWLERSVRLVVAAVRVALRGERPSVIYAWSALATPAAVLAGVLLGRPTIGGLFGTFLFPHLGTVRGRIGNFEEVIAFRSPVDRLLITNDGTRGDEVASSLGVRSSRVRFWMNGIDFESCAAVRTQDGRSDLGLPSDAPLIVWSSRLVEWKRVDRLLRAVPDVVGSERPALEHLAHRLSIDASVRFLGSVPREVNFRLIASADVFCSLYDYSCVGVGLLEALACGVSVVVADTGATRDFVEDGVNGLVVRPDDDGATAAAILRVLGDRDLRTRLQNGAKARAEERFLTRAQRASLELEAIAEIAAS